MVRETKTLGGPGQEPPAEAVEGAAGGQGEEATPPKPRNVAVYESTRLVEDWELATVAEDVVGDYDKKKQWSWPWVHLMQEVMTREGYSNISSHYHKKGDAEVQFQVLMGWKRSQPGGLATLGALCKLLQQAKLEELAESFEP